jgi:hypothetical protein
MEQPRVPWGDPVLAQSAVVFGAQPESKKGDVFARAYVCGCPLSQQMVKGWGLGLVARHLDPMNLVDKYSS